MKCPEIVTNASRNAPKNGTKQTGRDRARDTEIGTLSRPDFPSRSSRPVSRSSDLSSWERGFVVGCARHKARHGSLTEKQTVALAEIEKARPQSVADLFAEVLLEESLKTERRAEMDADPRFAAWAARASK